MQNGNLKHHLRLGGQEHRNIMKTRLKMHAFPGDIGIDEKIQMLEGIDEDHAQTTLGGLKTYTKRAKSFKKMVLSKERAVLKRRARKEISDND